MIEYLRLFKTFIGLTSKVLMGIAFFSFIAIIAPATLLNSMGLLAYRDDNVHWLWLALLASGCFLASRSLFWFFPIFKNNLNSWVVICRGKKRLNILSEKEKEILSYYFDNNNRSQTLSLMSGYVTGLIHEKILYRATEITEEVDIYDFNIQPWARKYLKKHPKLLK